MPLAHGWLVHQVRPTDRGAEMRSRFFLNHPELLELLPADLGHDLLVHCASEMNHLASFLPQLHAEFNDTP